MPTLEELLKYTEFFIAKYEEAGVKEARPKIRALLYKYLERRSMETALKRTFVDEARAMQRMQSATSPQKTPKTWSSRRATSIKRNKLSNHKKIAKIRIVRLRYRLALDKFPNLEQKLAKFPEIEFDRTDLRTDDPSTLMTKHFRKRWRRKPAWKS